MSSAVFPVLPGLMWDVKKTPVWKTAVQSAVSGKELRVAYMQYPLWQFTLAYEVLRGDANAEFQTLLGFFLARQGMFDSFLYADPTDNAVTAASFGIGDGVTTAFQLTRALGGFVEPVQNVNGAPSVFVNTVAEPSAALTSPAAPTLGSTAGGTIAATTYYVKTTYVGPTGETLPSAESSLAVALNNLLTVTSPATQTGATGYNVYVSTATGTETKQNGATPIAIGTGWTEPTSGLVSGSALPASNTTGWSVSSTGLVTFNAAPAVGAALTWTGGFYYRVRFLDDTSEFNQFIQNFWENKRVRLQSVKV